MPFEKGQSGNPNGKVKGTLNKATVIAQSLFDAEVKALAKKVVQLALDGDVNCLRICMSRLLPVKKEAEVEIDLPDISSVADIPKLFAAITERLREGITPTEALMLIDLAQALLKTLEMVELEVRVTALEQASQPRRA